MTANQNNNNIDLGEWEYNESNLIDQDRRESFLDSLASDASCDLSQLASDNVTERIENMFAGDQPDSQISLPKTPDNVTRFREMLIEEKASRSGKGSFSYYHTMKILARYTLRRIKSDVYKYEPDYGYYRLLDDNDLKTLVRVDCDEVTQCQLTKFEMADIVERIQTEPSISVPLDYFDGDQYLVNFRNGTLDLRLNQFLPHSEDFKMTAAINADYLEQYCLDGTEFDRFLTNICDGAEQKREHLQEITGYNLSSFYSIKRSTVFNGPRDSGKSTYNRLLQRLVGNENTSNFSMSELGKQFTLGKLLTKKINIYSERGASKLKDVEVFKAITGGDWAETENKGCDFVSRPSRTKLVFAGNSLPIFENADDYAAFLDRVTLFIFSKSIPKDLQDKGLDDRLSAERDIIVSWAMDGLRRLISTNFSFSEVEDARATRTSNKALVDTTADFLSEHCLIQPSRRVFSKDLYKRYSQYCRDNAFFALSQKEFIADVIAKTEGKGPVHKKLRIGYDGPYYGFDTLGLYSEDRDFSGTCGDEEQ